MLLIHLKHLKLMVQMLSDGTSIQAQLHGFQRDFQVIPVASPTVPEKERHFLWRFWTRMPKSGHIHIFDRTWYGRVMVERLEGFCSEDDWKRAFNEINEFEHDLTEEGAVVLKFWLQIDKDTQLARFTDRQNTPLP